jgi:hypothetical protein
MKYIKKYEAIEYNSLFDIDDYVYVNPDYFTNNNARLGRIIENDGGQVPYKILTSIGEYLWISPTMILRKMTDEEIEQYEIELNSDKYNL